MDMNLEQFYELLLDENVPIQITIDEDGNLSIVAPEEVNNNQEMVMSLASNAEKVIWMSSEMGMMFPDSVMEAIRTFVEGEKNNGR